MFEESNCLLQTEHLKQTLLWYFIPPGPTICSAKYTFLLHVGQISDPPYCLLNDPVELRAASLADNDPVELEGEPIDPRGFPVFKLAPDPLLAFATLVSLVAVLMSAVESKVIPALFPCIPNCFV